MPASSQRLRPEPSGELYEELSLELVVDGGPHLGFGHVGRCLALWEELKGRAVFCVSDPSVAALLRARGASVLDRPAAPLADSGGTPFVVLDHAAPASVAQVRTLQARGRRVALLDDAGPARAAADLVIDPPTAAAWPAAAGRRLAGFEHVLLRQEVRTAVRPKACADFAGGRRTRGGVLLAMGGSDPAGLTPVLAASLEAVGVEVTVALGPGYRGSFPTAGTVLGDHGMFIGALARAELLVTGYGHTLLEAAHLGVPAIAVVHRPEHGLHARAFCRAGTAWVLDLAAGQPAGELVDLVARLLADTPARAQMAARGRELVDGFGAGRVLAVLEVLA
jgi:spore coat polysaccharide biosynthesis predicted glycosyltransferase SpsG